MLKHIKVIISIFLKLLGLAVLLSFERVVGLPLIFSLLGLILIDQSHFSSYSRPLWILIISFLMAIFYQAAWLITLIVWILCLIGMIYGDSIIKEKKRRFLVLIIVQNLIWLWLLKIPASVTLLIQFVISYVLVVIWLKLFKNRGINEKLIYKK